MDNIFVYDPETLALREVVLPRKLNSCIWNRRFYDAGSFQLNLKATGLRLGDIIQQGDNAGIVMKIVVNFSGVVVYGYTLNAITKFRHIFKAASYTGTPEQIFTAIATEVLTKGDRAIPTLSVLTGQTSNATSYTLSFENNNVFDKLQEFSRLCEVSYDVQFSGDNLVFKCLQGRDMTDFLMFGRRYRTVDSMEYTQDDYNSQNVIFSSYEKTNGTTGDTQTVYTTTGAATGFLRREAGVTNYEEAETAIANNKLAQSLKGTANEKRKYKVDWMLGDYVTVAFEDLITEKQIVEVQEVYEKSNTTILPIFGEEKQNPIRKIMRNGG